jgi:hypothetical protein
MASILSSEMHTQPKSLNYIRFLHVHVNVDIRKNLLDPKTYVAFGLAITSILPSFPKL